MAIDASLLVPNAGGMRDVERRLRLRGVRTLPTSRAFLGRHFGGSRGEGIVAALEPMGFSLAQGDMPVFETFPRAILKAAAGARLPRYKSGAPEVRMAGCRELGARLRSRFPPLAGGMDRLLSANAHQAADMIDALACAICVHSHWRYAGQRTEVVRGDDGTHVLLLREDNVRD
jgi:predicted nuclease with RNAse H fold